MKRELLSRVVLPVPPGTGVLSLYREDLSSVYPGMLRYLLLLEVGDRTLALFSTNTYEYPPLLPIDAERAARQAARDWESALRSAPGTLPRTARPHAPSPPAAPGSVLILQGSPRPDGACAVLAGWAAEAARSVDRPAEVVFVHDLEIRPCIGCYQCYNAGECTFDDDMTALIPSIRAAAVLVVCSPVYTNTVPAGLKALIDRTQALHARTALAGTRSPTDRAGVLLASAGRQGAENFDCVRGVVRPFMANIGIRLCSEVLADDMDRRRDTGPRPELEEQVGAAILSALRLGSGMRMTDG